MKLIQQAREDYLSGDLFWATPLVNHLEEIQLGLSLSWVVESLKNQLLKQPSNNQYKIEWLDDLMMLKKSVSTFEELMNKCEDIWYHPGRDSIQTAISRLYAALAGYTQGHLEGFRRDVVHAIDVVSRDEDLLPEFLDIVFETFKRISQNS